MRFDREQAQVHPHHQPPHRRPHNQQQTYYQAQQYANDGNIHQTHRVGEEVSAGEDSDDEDDEDDDDDDEEDENDDEIILKRIEALKQQQPQIRHHHHHHHQHNHNHNQQQQQHNHVPVNMGNANGVNSNNNEKLVELSCGDRDFTRISTINTANTKQLANPTTTANADFKGRLGSTNNLSQEDCLSTIHV